MIKCVKMSEEVYIAMKLHALRTEPPYDINLPEGCVGIVYVFEDEISGKIFSGKDTKFLEANYEPIIKISHS